jgi:hypothetical protein|tara:strand:+ start:129 stop:368 length:240 start_codon:yes stop_codon:yes gene_type:complete
MANVYAGCGHIVDKELRPSFVWDWNEHGKLIVSMEVICEDCFLIDDKNGEILSREDVLNFLHDEVAINSNMRYSGDIYP